MSIAVSGAPIEARIHLEAELSLGQVFTHLGGKEERLSERHKSPSVPIPNFARLVERSSREQLSFSFFFFIPLPKAHTRSCYTEALVTQWAPSIANALRAFGNRLSLRQQANGNLVTEP